MQNSPKNIDFEGILTLAEVSYWMDGGSVSLMLTDENETEFEIVFCQRVILEIHSYTKTWIPGSFLLNDVEIPIRSTEEKAILNALKKIIYSDAIYSEDIEIIKKEISFVESEEYLKIATKMGRT